MDITEFRIPAGKVYLSPVIDSFDGVPIIRPTESARMCILTVRMWPSRLFGLRKRSYPVYWDRVAAP